MTHATPEEVVDLQSRRLLDIFPPLGDRTIERIETSAGPIPRITAEFWRPGQRNGHSLHEISYRACYKSELPAMFIQALTHPGDAVYDPFGGRGTTALEAALRGRRPASNDVNPLSRMLLEPRLSPPDLRDVEARLSELPRRHGGQDSLDLSMFFHPDTEMEIRSMRDWFGTRIESGAFDVVDGWIRMVALNRLTGHSSGFFSVYSLPPNQAMPARKQAELNALKNRVPPYRDTHALILKKSRTLLRDFDSPESMERLRIVGRASSLHCGSADDAPGLEDGSIDLVVTSPPFLDVVQYHSDNWMRNWFARVDAARVESSFIYERTVDGWCGRMGPVIAEQYRVLKPGGWLVMEVGEVRKSRLNLEELLIPLGMAAGFSPEGILVHAQAFTKTAHIWGVKNNQTGTNTHRMALFRKAPEGPCVTHRP